MGANAVTLVLAAAARRKLTILLFAAMLGKQREAIGDIYLGGPRGSVERRKSESVPLLQ